MKHLERIRILHKHLWIVAKVCLNNANAVLKGILE
jgi:hypothetical protein